jgi:hypothetical protein
MSVGRSLRGRENGDEKGWSGMKKWNFVLLGMVVLVGKEHCRIPRDYHIYTRASTNF